MLILDDPRTWPDHIRRQLKSDAVIRLVKQNEFVDRIAKEPDIRDVFADVDAYAKSVGLAGYHCTKELPERPLSQMGLRPLEFETHHAEVKEIIRGRVPTELFDRIVKGLDEWKLNHSGKREGWLWFCLTRHLVLDGTEDFFDFFGGEAVYMAFYQADAEVEGVFRQIGEPVVVEARINTEHLTTFRSYPLGRTLVSYFANAVNPAFNLEDLEGPVTRPISPADVVAVHPHNTFVAALRDLDSRAAEIFDWIGS